MSALADFGPLVASVDVDAAVLATLEKWYPTHLGKLNRGRATDVGLPRSYDSVVEEDQFLDHRLPAVLATTAKVEGQPDVYAGGIYGTWWLVAVSVVTRGRRAKEAKRLASFHEAVARQVMLQHMDLEGLANEVQWLSGGEVRPLPNQTGKSRYLAEGASQFLVFVQSVVQVGVGPEVPDLPEYDALAQVTSAPTITVDGLPTTATLGG